MSGSATGVCDGRLTPVKIPRPAVVCGYCMLCE